MGHPVRKKASASATPYDTQPRKLFYRPHVKWSYFFLLGAAGLVELLAILSGVLIGVNSGIATGMIVFVTASILPLLLLLEAHFLIRPMAYSFVQLYSKHLQLNRIGKIINIPYSEITKIDFSYLPYIGGWFVLHTKDHKPLRFSVVLERSELILDTLVVHRPELFDEKKFHKYRRTAIYSDHSWARIYEKANTWPRFLAKYLLFPLVAGFVAAKLIGANENSDNLKLVLRFLQFNTALGFAFYLLGEFMLGKKLHKSLTQVPSALARDQKFERKTHRKVQLFYYGAAITMFLLLAFHAMWLAS